MQIPTYLLFVLGCLGALDIALYHSVAHGIRSHADSAGELVTHSLRGPTYAALFLLIPNFEMHGLFAWGLMALFVFDVGISILDFSLEQGSRRFLGGLPSGEYVLHMLMAIVFGALVMSILYLGYNWFTTPTRLIWIPKGTPVVLRLALSVMALAVLGSGIQDAAAALRLMKLRSRTTNQRADQNTGTSVLNVTPEGINLTELSTQVDAHTPEVPPWMKMVLTTAGIYNLVWGAWIILFPSALFRWAGMLPANYPQIWQCVGMIVGVYGIGYLIASHNPFCHWPMVFVGLLGKVLGPLGMGWAVIHGTLSPSFAWVCLTNDLIWWWPFSLILLRVIAGPPKTSTDTHLSPEHRVRPDVGLIVR